MTLLFSNLVKQALTTFDIANFSSLKSNFTLLKKLTDQLTIKDINLDEHLISNEEFNRPDKAPCTFVHIFQNDTIAMSVFILQKGFQMPLHDHPMMNGLLKVLSGKLLVQSYTKKVVDENHDDKIINPFENDLKVCVEPPLILNCESESAVLSPIEKNYHEITAIDGVAAFFDILSPPYDANMPIYGKRKCNFYAKALTEPEPELVIAIDEKKEINIEKIPTPQTYYCDTGNYERPEFLLKYNDTYCESDSS